ncbi:response regulator transcription factor [Anoxynatronum buryatiense]|nr:response regulator transcription factor [Anoxynatronum buryatiense]
MHNQRQSNSRQQSQQSEQHTVLVCDDDEAIVNALEVYLKQEGYRVLKAGTGRQALAILQQEPVQLIIMDIMMPEMDGLSATLKIRETQNIPLIMLSAKSEDTDKITGLHFGADDYVTKPFNALELMARVKSQLRRYTRLGSLPATSQMLVNGRLELDTSACELKVDGVPVRLTATEYKIVAYLMKHPGQVFSTGAIYEQVWEETSHAVENTVAVHIRRIREKIEINPKEPEYLKVVWGIGYKMEKRTRRNRGTTQ